LAISCTLLHDNIKDTKTNTEELKNKWREKVLNGTLALIKNGEFKKKIECQTV
jgi:(p)ppGpp synthase/HD superfamily hydrolase